MAGEPPTVENPEYRLLDYRRRHQGVLRIREQEGWLEYRVYDEPDSRARGRHWLIAGVVTAGLLAATSCALVWPLSTWPELYGFMLAVVAGMILVVVGLLYRNGRPLVVEVNRRVMLIGRPDVFGSWQFRHRVGVSTIHKLSVTPIAEEPGMHQLILEGPFNRPVTIAWGSNHADLVYLADRITRLRHEPLPVEPAPRPFRPSDLDTSS